MINGFCALCDQHKPLCKSHAIPNAIFRKILKESGGKAVRFTDDPDSIVDYTSDSWWDYMLCKDCEQFLNVTYDNYALSVFRGKIGRHARLRSGMVFSDIDLGRVNNFFLSMFWRAARSRNEAYAKIAMPEYVDSYIKNHIKNNTNVRPINTTVKISRLIDKTATNEGGFDMMTIKKILAAPYYRRHQGAFSFCFIIEGFYIELFFPGLGFKGRSAPGVVNPKSKALAIPYVDIFSIPEIVDAMRKARQKADNGMVRNGL